MYESIFSLWGMIIASVVFGSLVAIITNLAQEWGKTRRAEMEASLKLEMVKQGRSAEEIERLLKATSEQPLKEEE